MKILSSTSDLTTEVNNKLFELQKQSLDLLSSELVSQAKNILDKYLLYFPVNIPCFTKNQADSNKILDSIPNNVDQIPTLGKKLVSGSNIPRILNYCGIMVYLVLFYAFRYWNVRVKSNNLTEFKSYLTCILSKHKNLTEDESFSFGLFWSDPDDFLSGCI